MRKTKIICTLGPSTDKGDVLRDLIANGMNVARFNFSHGSYEEHGGRLAKLKALREELGPQATQRGSEDAPNRLRFDFPTDAGILNYLRGREFIADEVPFRRKYFG